MFSCFCFFKFGAIWYLPVWLILCFGDRVSALCSPDWSGNCPPPASASQVLGLQASAPPQAVLHVSVVYTSTNRYMRQSSWGSTLGVWGRALAGEGRHSGPELIVTTDRTVSPRNLTEDSHSLESLFCFGRRQWNGPCSLERMLQTRVCREEPACALHVHMWVSFVWLLKIWVREDLVCLLWSAASKYLSPLYASYGIWVSVGMVKSRCWTWDILSHKVIDYVKKEKGHGNQLKGTPFTKSGVIWVSKSLLAQSETGTHESMLIWINEFSKSVFDGRWDICIIS